MMLMIIQMMILMMILMTKPYDYDDDMDDDNDHNNDRYTAAGAAPGASVPYYLFIYIMDQASAEDFSHYFLGQFFFRREIREHWAS